MSSFGRSLRVGLSAISFSAALQKDAASIPNATCKKRVVLFHSSAPVETSPLWRLKKNKVLKGRQTVPELVEGNLSKAVCHFDRLSDRILSTQLYQTLTADSQLSILNSSVPQFLNFGVIPKNTSKLIPGIGRESTERYSSLKRLLTAPFIEKSAHLHETVFSNAILLIKY